MTWLRPAFPRLARSPTSSRRYSGTRSEAIDRWTWSTWGTDRRTPSPAACSSACPARAPPGTTSPGGGGARDGRPGGRPVVASRRGPGPRSLRPRGHGSTFGDVLRPAWRPDDRRRRHRDQREDHDHILAGGGVWSDGSG